MGRNHQTPLAPLERGEVLKGLQALSFIAEIQQQHMAALNSPLETGDEDETTASGVGTQRREIELAVVQRNRQCLVAEVGGPIDQLQRGVRDNVRGVVRCVRMQFNFDRHVSRAENGMPPPAAFRQHFHPAKSILQAVLQYRCRLIGSPAYIPQRAEDP
jgi:hypothetical protein